MVTPQLVKPGEVNVKLQRVPNPLAQPVAAVIPSADGMTLNMVAFGGMSRVEMLAGMVAGPMMQALLDAQNADGPPYPFKEETNKILAGAAVDVAEAILDEIAERTRAHMDAAAEENGEP